LTNVDISARISELKTTISEGVVASAIRRRSWCVQLLQNRVDRMLALSDARALMYADQKGESYEFQVNDLAAEEAAIADGCHVCAPVGTRGTAPLADRKDLLGATPPPPPVYPKSMIHPGHPNGPTGLLVKDYRGKNAEQVIWKTDTALEARIADNLKQASIEEGQWAEKRDLSGTMSIAALEARINSGRDYLAADKKARDAKLAATRSSLNPQHNEYRTLLTVISRTPPKRLRGRMLGRRDAFAGPRRWCGRPRPMAPLP
jgi:hypothetical protein